MLNEFIAMSVVYTAIRVVMSLLEKKVLFGCIVCLDFGVIM